MPKAREIVKEPDFTPPPAVEQSSLEFAPESSGKAGILEETDLSDFDLEDR
ncbi:hypothetical protein D3C86_2116950 [compost metagenome]